MGVELNEKVLGIVGFGRIGRELAKRAIAMDMDAWHTIRLSRKSGLPVSGRRDDVG